MTMQPPQTPRQPAPSEQWGPWYTTHSSTSTNQESQEQPALTEDRPHQADNPTPQDSQKGIYDPLHRRLAFIGIAGGSLLLLMSIIWSAILINVLRTPFQATGSSPDASLYLLEIVVSSLLVIATLGGGGSLLYHSIHKLQGKTSLSLRLPAISIWLSLYLAVMLHGYATYSTGLVHTMLPIYLPALILASILPAFIFITFFIRINPQVYHTSWRRGAAAFAYGAGFATHILFILLFFFSEIAVDQFYACFSINCAGSDNTYAGVFFLAVVVPFFEELFKPLLLLPLLKRIKTTGEVVLLGSICGAGYGMIEGSIFTSTLYNDWIFVLLLGILFSILQGLCTALVLAGWYVVLYTSRQHLLKGLVSWSLGLFAHIAINASIAGVLLPESISLWSWSWQVGSIQLSSIQLVFLIDILLLITLFFSLHLLSKPDPAALESAETGR